MKKILTYTLFWVIGLFTSSFSQSWKLVWSDEFDGPAINSANWSFEIGTGNSGWGNNELQYYTNRSENARIENGKLLIAALKESYGGRSYTSARLKTQGKKFFKYGRIEALIKIPMGSGSWPAFWMLGENITSVGWPKCGEIDIMEHVNNNSQINGAAHWDNNGHAQYSFYTNFDVSQFNLYAVEWNSTQIRWFINFKPFMTMSIANGINGTEEFQNPFFIILNFAVGGNFTAGAPITMPFPSVMEVDYVRAYELSTKIENEENIPFSPELLQNYPNPFNPETTIEYTIPVNVKGETAKVTLKVYDVLGREVTTLVDEYKSSGTYRTIFNISQLERSREMTSGVYFYRLQAGSKVETKKLVLMK